MTQEDGRAQSSGHPTQGRIVQFDVRNNERLKDMLESLDPAKIDLQSELEGILSRARAVIEETSTTITELDHEGALGISKTRRKDALVRRRGQAGYAALEAERILRAIRGGCEVPPQYFLILGRIDGIMHAAVEEENAVRGEVSMRAARSGHQFTHGTSEEKRRRWDFLCDCYDEVVDSNPDLTKTRWYQLASQRALDRCGSGGLKPRHMSASSVERAIRDRKNST